MKIILSRKGFDASRGSVLSPIFPGGLLVAQELRVGDRVYVPCFRLGLSNNGPSAFHHTTVRGVVERSVEVDVPGGTKVRVASQFAHRNVGVLIVRIGDFDTETTLLDPLKKSLLQYCRLLLPDDQVVLYEIRTRGELSVFWTRDHAAFSHVVLVAHGCRTAIRFGDGDWANPTDFAALLAAPEVTPKVIVSLACETGRSTFGQALSRCQPCQAVVAPYQTVHGAVGSQFCQTFLARHFLDGLPLAWAFRKARTSVAGAVSFRCWEGGKLKAGART